MKEKEQEKNSNKETGKQRKNQGLIRRLDNELTSLGNDLERMFWGEWPRGNMSRVNETRLSIVDIKDDGEQYVVEAELPGIEKEDIEIEVKRNQLEICGEKSHGEEVDDDGYYLRERSYSRFYRRLPFPEDVIPEKTKASIDDGILHIELPKENPAPPDEPFSVSIEK